VTGEVLGTVGSSGNSSGPHLHFELYDAADQLVDPYAGSCNAISSWWANQRPYDDSAINKVATHSSAPQLMQCDPAITNLNDGFARGDRVIFAAYYRDQLIGQQGTYRVYRPNGSVAFGWSHSSSDPYYAASYWIWYIDLLPTAPLGTWRFEVDYEGELYVHEFTVAEPEQTPALPLAGLVGLVASLAAVASFRIRRELAGQRGN
jgi:murein DD-endopeptidase MepM/ murein hydrolase activator NlpD